MTSKQIEQVVDILKSIGLAALIGCVADAFVAKDRYLADAIGAAVGMAALIAAVNLTKKINGDKL